MPAVQRDLGSPVSGLQWTLDAHTIVPASLLTAAGSTADRVGRRRAFRLGLVLSRAPRRCAARHRPPGDW
ncbi:hypothetical protein [Streptomyces sp. NPDC006739]|uniref:hypothetical protein n=1 Tax=Streptomyces sp. NPDC006739 TaxID=3364763 RepID=UPI00369D242F